MRTFRLALLKRSFRVDLIEHPQHGGVGRGLAIERQSQVGPDLQSDVTGWIVSHERVVAGHFESVKVHLVRPKGDLGYPIPIFLAARLSLVLRLKAIKPLALVVSIEKLATNQCPHQGRDITGGRDGASCCASIGRILPRVVIGLEGPGPGRHLKLGGQDASTKAYDELPYK